MMQLPSSAPAALAHVAGPDGSGPSGMVSFFPLGSGVLVVAQVHGLPDGGEGACGGRVFGFHIHEGGACTPPDFEDAGGHFNPDGCDHPYHAGDLPPLFGCRGEAFLAVLTDRFSIPEIIGRTVVIHGGPDDFASQPAGHSGAKIACGVIRSL